VSAALLAATVQPSAPAEADVTPLSEVSKTGTNLTSGSTAASAAAPGGAVTGSAHPGDTLKWVVSYQNRAGGKAAVDLKDPFPDAGAYVDGSLQLPPNPDPTSPFGAQYSTDSGANWSGGTPPAAANGVGLAGTFPPGTQQLSTNPPAPVEVALNNGAGDGYNAVSSPDDSLVYAVFHHNRDNPVFCATSSGALCPGWPTGSNTSATYVSPDAGTPIGTGSHGMTTAEVNGTFLVGDRLYWEAQTTVAAQPTGPWAAGMMCLDLSTLLSCGFTPLSATSWPPNNQTYAMIAGNGLAAADGRYYFADSDGRLLCFDPASGACGVFVLPGASGNSDSRPWSATYGNTVFALNWSDSSFSYQLSCVQVSGPSTCPGYPIALPSAFGGNRSVASLLLPIVSTAGVVSGVCAQNNQVQFGCWDLSGQSVPAAYPATVGSDSGFTGDAYVSGTRVYAPVQDGDAVGCFDFSRPLQSGIVQPCAGFTPPANPTNYTVRPMTGDPTCMLADGDGRTITSFDATTGAACSTTRVAATVSPAEYYCGSGDAGFTGWGRLSIAGAAAGAFQSATVTLTGADGAVVPGFAAQELLPGQTIDLSSIPKSAPTNVLTASVVFHTTTTAVRAAQVSISWAGKSPEMCFQTTAPMVGCGQSTPLSNDAVAVTDATGGGTDAPGGNRSGTATFLNTPVAGSCSLEVAKTAPTDPVTSGDTVTYRIVVRNTGTSAYLSGNPASFRDDLTDVLRNASYNADASATEGSTSFASPVLSWTGPPVFAPGDTATVTYSVTAKGAMTAPLTMVNTVEAPDSNCETGSTDPACTVTVPIASSLRWNKVDDTASKNRLSGSEWSLQRLDGNGDPSGAAILVTDCVAAPCPAAGADEDPAAGSLLVAKLSPGSYALTETKAPVGYRLNPTPIPVTISTAVQLTTLPDVVNEQLPALTLPLTGGLGTDVIAFWTWGLLGTAIALLAWQLRRTTLSPLRRRLGKERS